MSRTMYDENDIDHWITVRGARIPVLKDGTLGVGTKEANVSADTIKKKMYNVNTAVQQAREAKDWKTYKEATEEYNRLSNILKETEDQKKPSSRNAKYDTSRTKNNSGKKRPTSLEAFKENSNQFVQALKEAEKQGALEFEFTDMTGKVFHRWWDGAKFVDRKVSQSMERRYGKRSGTFKSSFRKPDDWE